jgi:ubiquinone/menaquinone biosynthesis C-methylase UbiE
MFNTLAKQVIRKTAFTIVRAHDPVTYFHSNQYLRQTARRLEHLASLRIAVAGMSVLEIGAGIGDLSHFYTDRGCAITITDARPENLEYLKTRYPDCRIQALDMEHPSPIEGSPFDVVHCYGLLYHLSDPGQALAFLSRSAGKLLFLETCVSFGDDDLVNPVSEKQYDLTQAYSGTGCRPTRSWLFNKLGEFFKYVYLPKTQPWHEEFPLDWTAPEKHAASLQRAVFIASHEPLEQDVLVPSLIMKQTRHE